MCEIAVGQIIDEGMTNDNNIEKWTALFVKLSTKTIAKKYQLKDWISDIDVFKASKGWLDQAKANATFINWRWNEGQYAPDKGYDPAIHGTSNYDVLKAFIEMQQANKK